MFDLTKKSTLDNIDFWRNEVAKFVFPDVPVFLMGIKLDLEEEWTVLEDDAMSYAKRHNLSWSIETSTHEDTSGQIEKLFGLVAERILQKIRQKTTLVTFSPTKTKAKEKGVELTEGKNEQNWR